MNATRNYMQAAIELLTLGDAGSARRHGLLTRALLAGPTLASLELVDEHEAALGPGNLSRGSRDVSVEREGLELRDRVVILFRSPLQALLEKRGLTRAERGSTLLPLRETPRVVGEVRAKLIAR